MPHRLRVPICRPAPVPAKRSIARSIWRGLRRRCPKCGIGAALDGYLGIREACDHCGEPLGHIRADDGPAYFTLLIAGHVVVPLVLLAEQLWHPPMEAMLAVAVTGMAALIWRLLPRIKGGVLGLMWALGLSGDEVQDDRL
ncbi:hypothetical protein CU669_10355 [Paramagnetospirillum kuznetsovii]|uniref:DUF983 domain-containing protein n=1 Tax=Paramagnetospirillum kuznetsovii TaxID=2053833 RepID=A0A364NYT7_9PROT|nr:DUF983 domain-containing protein [Paramagnetospirillum kuznetsovii]RAU22077.1 hypothetical protein CU669_10355 [Paramagnetospirillum kuznetsovii]